MYELDTAWSAYYAEIEPKERLRILDSLPEDGDWPAEFCRRLWRERYGDPKHPGREVDNWLWKCVYLPGMYQRRRSLKKQLQAEAASMLSDLHLGDPAALTEEETAALYHEFRNTARRYLSTCRDRDYGRKFFGLKRAGGDEQRKKAGEDIWAMSRGFALAAGQEEALRPWCDAFYAELAEFDPKSRERFDELADKFTK